MSSHNSARAGAFLSQAPRRKGAIAVVLDLYATHNGFRFLSNFVLFGWLTLACLALSSGLSAPGGLPNPAALISQIMPFNAPSKAAEPAGPVATTPATPSGSSVADASDAARAAALVDALGKAADPTPPAPLFTDYKLTSIPPGDTGATLARALAAIHQGGSDNVETGVILLQRAADAGLPAAMALYGLARLAPPDAMAADPSAGREWLQRAADSGDPQAAHLLAGAYLTGAAGFSDSTKAATLYRRASDLGDTGAGLALAGLLARGIGGPIDLPQAEQRVRIAAAGGDPAAMAALGRYLTTSAVKGWSPNFDEAMFWLTRVADKGDLAAMEQLGDIQMFLAKSGPAQDPAKGFAWFKRCADAGRASCHFALGRAYGLALGTSGDLAQAWAHMTLARDAGQSGAQSQLDALDTRLTPAQRSEAVSILSRLKNPAAG